MDNQHRKITGYSELSQEDIDMMNEIKAEGVRLQALTEKVRRHVDAQYKATTADTEEANAEGDRLTAADPYTWLNAGQIGLQVALMELTRAVAQPTTF